MFIRIDFNIIDIIHIIILHYKIIHNMYMYTKVSSLIVLILSYEKSDH